MPLSLSDVSIHFLISSYLSFAIIAEYCITIGINNYNYFRSYLSLVTEVCLVADEHDDDVGAPLRPHVVNPLARLVEAVGVGDVVDDDGHGAVADVRGDEGAEALLSRRVPQLEADGAVLKVHRLGQEVDADRGLEFYEDRVGSLM